MTRSDGHRFVQGLAALFFLAGFAVPPEASGQAQTPAKSLGVTVKAGGPAGAPDAPLVSLAIPGDAPASASTSALLLIENASGTKVEGLRILAYLIPEAGQSAAAPTISTKVAGAEMPASGWTIEAGKSLPVTLTVSNVDPSATFEGSLVGVRGEADYGVLARVKVARVGAQLKFLGTGPDGAAKLDLSINALRWRLTGESTGPSAFDLDLVATALVGPNGQMIAPRIRVSGRATAVEPTNDRPAEAGVVHARVSGPGLLYVDLDANVIAAGTYSGSVELRPAKGIPATARLTVTRTRLPAPLEIKPPDPVHDVTYPFRRATEVRISLKETSGQSVTLSRPALAALARKDDGARVQADANVERVVDAEDRAVDFPLVLDPGAVRLLRIQLSDLREPGEYTGTLQFGATDFAVIEQSVTVMKKHSVWVAGIVILVGIFLSFGQRTLLSRTLPRKRQVRDASKLTLRLRDALRALPALNAAEQDASASLANEFNTIHDEADGKDATRDRLTTASEKLKLYILEVPARVLLDSVSPEPDSAQYRPRLTAALALVTNPDATAEQCKQSAAAIRSIPTELFATVRTTLEHQITAFAQEVRGQIDDLTIAPALRSDLQTQVETPLNESAARLTHAQGLPGVAAERTAFDTARGNYARVLSEELERVLAGEPPPQFTPDEWARLDWDIVGPELAAAVKSAGTDPTTAIDFYNRAFARYVYEVSVALTKKAKQQSQALSVASPHEDEQGKADRLAEKKRYDEEVIAVLDGAASKVREGNAREAATDYEQALGVYRELNPEPAAAPEAARALTTPGMWRLAAATAAGPAQGADALWPAVIDPATEIADIDRFTTATQIVVLVITLIFGTLTGLQTLWASNPTWGSWANVLAAFVWGAGLQQIAGLTADQFMDTLDRTVK